MKNHACKDGFSDIADISINEYLMTSASQKLTLGLYLYLKFVRLKLPHII
jgi:hypothetical protein